MFENDVTVPAGWYPDPMGLPQLRWWNNHAWTELTTEARPPLVMQQPQSKPTRVLYADEELPTRRQQREQREREAEYVRLATDAGEQRAAAAAHAPLTTTLREIDPPAVSESDDLTTTLPDRAGIDEGDGGIAESFDDIFQPRSATMAVSAPTAQNERARATEPEGMSSRSSAFPRRVLYTAPVWIIALLPLLQLVIGLLVLVAFGGIIGVGFTIAAFAGPYVAVIALALADWVLLRRAGYDRPAHWTWAILSAPVYLIARSVALSRGGELGLGPLLVWVALGMMQVASILVVPGMLISVIPTVFTAQAEQSVASEATTIGAKLAVSCPTPPPLIVGQEFSCSATSATGSTYDITVSLQRANGWIDWRVDDWGSYTLSR